MRRIALQLLVEVAGVGKHGDLKPLFGEVARQEVAQPHIIVDDEDLRRKNFVGHGQRLTANRAGRAGICYEL